jgi:hypothetical protein
MFNMKKIRLGKKGVGAEEWLEQIPYIILTIAVMIGIFLLVNMFVNISVNVKPLQVEVLFNRLMYSPDSIMYQDNITGTVYPGIVDYHCFTNDTLDAAITYSYERHAAARLDLYDQKKNLVKSAYLNGIWYNRLEPLASNWIQGGGGAAMYYKSIPVVYRENGVNKPGYMNIRIIIPN